MEKRAVLFVDDETVMLDLARDIFSKRKGYECFLADNAADALEVLRTEQIDVVVGDIYLRGVSGLELLAKIQKNHLDVGVIMVTVKPIWKARNKPCVWARWITSSSLFMCRRFWKRWKMCIKR